MSIDLSNGCHLYSVTALNNFIRRRTVCEPQCWIFERIGHRRSVVAVGEITRVQEIGMGGVAISLQALKVVALEMELESAYLVWRRREPLIVRKQRDFFSRPH